MLLWFQMDEQHRQVTDFIERQLIGLKQQNEFLADFATMHQEELRKHASSAESMLQRQNILCEVTKINALRYIFEAGLLTTLVKWATYLW